MWARWLAGTQGEADASERRSGRKGGGRGGGRGECDGLPPEQGFVAGWQGGGGGMQGGADAQLSRRSMQLHANPSNGRRLHSLPLYFSLSLASLFLSLSLFLSARSSSLPPVLFSRPYQPSAASLFLALSLFLLPRVLTRLVTPPFSLHPRSMTSVRGNAPQRRLLSHSLSLSISPCLSRSRDLPLPASLAYPAVPAPSRPPTPAMQFVYIGAGLLIAIDSS